MIRSIRNSLFRWLSLLLVEKVWIREVIGKEKIPTDGPVIVVANHGSYLDFLVLGTLFEKMLNKNLIFWANHKIFAHMIFKYYAQAFNSILLDLRNPSKKFWRDSLRALKNGKTICIFPEGTRSRTGELLDFNEGYLRLALQTGATIVPVVVENAYKLYPPGRIFPKFSKDVSLKVCDPVSLEKRKYNDDELLAINSRIRGRFIGTRECCGEVGYAEARYI